MKEKKDNIGLIVCIAIMSVIIILLGSICVINIVEQKNNQKSVHDEPEQLIKTSSSKGPSDDYGIIGELSILGKQIDSVLDGYTNGTDYSKKTSNGYKIYTFDDVKYSIGSHASLSIMTKSNSSTVSLIQYNFVAGVDEFYRHKNLRNLEKKISETYKVDAFYEYRDGISGYFERDGVYHEGMNYIMWETDEVRVTLMLSQYNSQTNPICDLIFEYIAE